MTSNTLYRPKTALDLLRIPLLGRLLKSRWGRLAVQFPVVIIAVLILIDGFVGPQNPARNLATVLPWVHYRGLVVVALLLVGNLFCMGCPFTLPRTLAKRLSIRGRRWPKALRGKWLAIGGLFALFFLYEWLDLWASPALTAWVVVFYFVASFALEALFTESAFCKYVCPLGTFNFVYSTAAPTQIMVKDREICRACVGKECISGRYAPTPTIRLDNIGGGQREVRSGPDGALGCGTLLFAPQITSNLDCTLCLDCVRACPHDNIGWMARAPGRELLRAEAWPKRWDISLLAIILAFMGVTNVFGMVPPIYDLLGWMVDTFGFQSEFIPLLLIFAVGNLLLPIFCAVLVGQLGRLFVGDARPLRDTVASFAPTFVPLGFGIWIAHYSFHFFIAPLTVIPILQEFWGGVGDWARWGGGLDTNIIGLLQVIALLGGFLWSVVIAQRIALRLYGRRAFLGFLPWVTLLLALMLSAWGLFTMPMEMRGTAFLFN